jgi:hypothetical protein
MGIFARLALRLWVRVNWWQKWDSFAYLYISIYYTFFFSPLFYPFFRT